MKNLLSSLRSYKQKKNEFRVAGLVKLSEVLETEGAPAAKLKPLYQEIVEASTDAEMAKQAQLRIQELSAGPKE
jgi:ectoine hydroxylase-related dioxygenase (phytanoyl-CoA dioxygenase family)